MSKEKPTASELIKRAKAHIDGNSKLEEADVDVLIRQLQEAAGYRLFTKSLICHGVYFYPTEDKAILAGLAVQLQGQKVMGGLYHGMQCGRDESFDHVDKQYGLVFGVTVA